MATGLSYVQSAEEDLICPLCLELFVDPHIPKLLDCPHVYCQTCLVTLLAGSRDKQTITCPECRKRTTIPDKDVTNLNTNLRLRSLAEKHAKHQQEMKQYECKDHDGEKLHFYCLTCQVSVCQACLVLIHERPKHEIKSIKEVHLEKVKILEATIKRNEKLISDFRKNIQHVSRCEQKVNASIKESEQEIDRVVAKAINDIKMQAQELKQHVHLGNKDMLEKCKKQKIDFEKKVCGLQNAVDNAQKILEIKTSHEYLEHHKQVTKQFIDLEAERKKSVPKKVALIMLKDDPALSVAWYGYNDKLPVNLGQVQKRVVRKLKLQHIFKFPHPITGVACGLARVVVNMQNKKLIEVYKHNAGKLTGHQCRLVPTEKDWHPFDVAVTKAGRILVARWNCVEQFSFEGKHVNTISMNRPQVHESITSSVTTTEDGNILVADFHNDRIECYSSDGNERLGHTLVTNCSLTFTLDVIDNKHVAASNLDDGVSIYDFLKDQIKSHITVPNPTALCYDNKSDCLLIGCQDINAVDGAVIEQYCWQSGAKIATLAHGLKDPQDMALTDDGKYLVVGDENMLEFYRISTEKIL